MPEVGVLLQPTAAYVHGSSVRIKFGPVAHREGRRLLKPAVISTEP